MLFVFNSFSVRQSLFLKSFCNLAMHHCSGLSKDCLVGRERFMKRVSVPGRLAQESWYATLQSLSHVEKTANYLKRGNLCWTYGSKNALSNQWIRIFVSKVQGNGMKTELGNAQNSIILVQDEGKKVIEMKKRPEVSDLRRLISLAKPERWRLIGNEV